jgi:hypothetical protein
MTPRATFTLRLAALLLGAAALIHAVADADPAAPTASRLPPWSAACDALRSGRSKRAARLTLRSPPTDGSAARDARGLLGHQRSSFRGPPMVSGPRNAALDASGPFGGAPRMDDGLAVR